MVQENSRQENTPYKTVEFDEPRRSLSALVSTNCGSTTISSNRCFENQNSTFIGSSTGTIVQTRKFEVV
jgi:hypothetical protein